MSETCPRAERADQYHRFAKSDDDTSFLGRRASRDFKGALRHPAMPGSSAMRWSCALAIPAGRHRASR